MSRLLSIVFILSLGVCIVFLDRPYAFAQPQPEKGNDAEPKVTPIPEEVIKKYKLDTTFYKKHLDYKGFSILSSAKVSDASSAETWPGRGAPT